MPDLKLYLFGVPRLEFDGQPLEINRRKSLALAAYIAMANMAVSREALAALLWPEVSDDQARGSLRTALSSLTTITPIRWLQVDHFLVSLEEDQIEIDTRLFLSYLAQSRLHTHPEGELCVECLGFLQQAEALYQTHFLAGFTLTDSAAYEDWQSLQTDLLQREYAGILRRIARHYQHIGDSHQAINYALRWLTLDPLHEPAHRLLMQLYQVTGQRTEALRQYQTCVDLLDQELAAVPEDETIQLYEAIRDNLMAPAARPARRSGTAVNFLPSVPPLLVGREGAIHDLKGRLGIRGKRRTTTVIQGLPGIGKSTIVASLAHDADLAAAFPDGILWISLGEDPDVMSKLRSWADVLQVEAGKITRPEELSTRISTRIHDKHMLLLVDDVWKVEHSTPFRVGGSSSAIIFTSRLNDIASLLASSPLDLYNLAVLSDESGLRLLEILTPDTVHNFPEESRELVRNLEGLPLAIQVAGRLLHNEEKLGWGVVDLLAELREGTRLLAEPAPSDMLRVVEGITPTISALLRRSTDTLNPLTCERFALLGLFAPKPATFDLGAINAIWGVDDSRPTTRELVNRGLLEPVGGGRFQLHALLVAHARSMLEI